VWLKVFSNGKNNNPTRFSLSARKNKNAFSHPLNIKTLRLSIITEKSVISLNSPYYDGLFMQVTTGAKFLCTVECQKFTFGYVFFFSDQHGSPELP
jgi:hypothetical protein